MKKTMTQLLAAGLLAGLAMLGAGCQTTKGVPVYTRYNIHVLEAGRGGKQYTASYLNYTDPKTGHLIIPVNTPVRVGRSRGGFVLLIQDDDKKVMYDYEERHMRLSLKAYLDKITSPEPVSLEHFGETDLKGIRDGKAYAGMTKEGVMTALGYPVTSKTPSPDTDKVWVYWADTKRSYKVEFDDAGKVKSVGN